MKSNDNWPRNVALTGLLILLMMLVLPATGMAQRAKKKKKAPQPKKVEVVEEDPRIAQMMSATQKVVFIDSIVADANDFMQHIPLSKECGQIKQTGSLGMFTNEMGDHRLTAVRANKRQGAENRLMASDFVGNEWTKPVAVEGLGSGSANYPYMMPDGTTLYFAQTGKNSIGGYDIFVTRYDAASGAFLRPENIGMPFASEANDYLYVVDEAQQLGYFVTDRRQPKGKVCIYVFIPSQKRESYDVESTGEEKLKDLAGISRIADTWGNGRARKEALERLARARAAKQAKTTTMAGGKGELEALRHQAEVMEKSLELARSYYASASESERQKVAHDILKNEKELETLQLTVKQKEKEERNKKYHK